MQSKITVNQEEVKAITFSGGERHLSVPYPYTNHLRVNAHLMDSNAIMDLLLVADALKRHVPTRTIDELHIPYLPYARQDRVCNPDEPHSLAVMAGLINSIGAKRVVIWDAHSSVAEALINNYDSMTITEIFQESGMDLAKDYDVLIAPDAGAEKKVGALGRHFGLPVEVARKVRDTLTGDIVKTAINCETDLTGKRVLVVDDICDGGRTFIELAKVLRGTYQMKELGLYVTHGIFSKGLNALGNPYFDTVYHVDGDFNLAKCLTNLDLKLEKN